MFDIDDLGFDIEFKERIKEKENFEKVVFVVYPLLNGKRINNDSVCVNLYQLAVVFQRLKVGLSPTDIMPYTCTCGDNGCINVFSSLTQKVGLLRVEWVKPKEAYEDENNQEYDFLEKNKYSFSKKKLLENINKLFLNIEDLQEKNKETCRYDVEALYSLNNAMLLWKGQEPVFESKEETIKKSIENGEDVDYNEVLSLKDIIEKTAQKSKSKPSEIKEDK